MLAPQPVRAARLGPTLAVALSVGWHAVLFAGLIAGSSRPASGALPASVAELQFQDIEPLRVEPPVPEPVRAPDPPAPKLLRASRPARAEPPPAPAPAAAPAPSLEPVSPVVAPRVAAPAALADSGAVAVQTGVAQAGATTAPVASRGTAAPAPAPRAPVVLGTGVGVGVDRSRPPGLAGATRWDCPFPSEADDAGLESALVKLHVEVRSDGALQGVRVVDDPGHGFGREARRCALQKRWQPGLNRDGATIAAAATVHVRFVR